MSTQDYQIRLMQRSELDTVMQWAAEEGWNPGLHDAECFYTADPQGFWVGELNGQPIAALSAVRYGAGFAFLGLYIVKPEYRGQGYGQLLWQAVLAKLGATALGIEVPAVYQDKFRLAGFASGHRNIRYQGPAVHKLLDEEAGVVSLSQIPARQILAYDRPFFPAGRTAFLRAWLHQPAAWGFALMPDDELRGYGLIRPCQNGYKIGPLYAEHPLGASALLTALMQAVPAASPVFLDIPASNENALKLAHRYGMSAVAETVRLYKGDAALPDIERTFGVTTLELG